MEKQKQEADEDKSEGSCNTPRAAVHPILVIHPSWLHQEVSL